MSITKSFMTCLKVSLVQITRCRDHFLTTFTCLYCKGIIVSRMNVLLLTHTSREYFYWHVVLHWLQWYLPLLKYKQAHKDYSCGKIHIEFSDQYNHRCFWTALLTFFYHILAHSKGGGSKRCQQICCRKDRTYHYQSNRYQSTLKYHFWALMNF